MLKSETFTIYPSFFIVFISSRNFQKMTIFALRKNLKILKLFRFQKVFRQIFGEFNIWIGFPLVTLYFASFYLKSSSEHVSQFLGAFFERFLMNYLSYFNHIKTKKTLNQL